jgi:uncharacterized membrane protein
MESAFVDSRGGGGDMVRNIGSDAATSLVAWFYESPRAAFQSLLALEDVERGRGLRSLGVSDAAVMSGVSSSGRIRVDRSIEFHEEKGTGALNAIFPESILSQPALGADAPSVAEHFSQLGFQSNVLREIGENLPVEGAALVVLLKEGWFDELNDVLSPEANVERWALDTEESGDT